jgi:hypothetical protein
MEEHYTEGRRYSHISKTWIFEHMWNDKEELAYQAAKQMEALAACESQVNELAEINKELLEALKEAAEFVDLHSEDWYKSGRALVEKCKAAIAKAEQ